MRMFSPIVVSAAIMALAASAGCAGPAKGAGSPPQGAADAPVHAGISTLRGPEGAKLLNRTVTVTGFYYDGTIPMLVDNYERILVDMSIPPDAYIPIVGPRPTGLKWGCKVSATGILAKPTDADDASVRQEPVVLRVRGPGDIKVLAP